MTLLSTNQGAPVAIIEGQPIGVFYGAFFAVDANGGFSQKPFWLSPGRKGYPTRGVGLYSAKGPDNWFANNYIPALRKVIGDPNPDYTASLVNEVTYKKASLQGTI